ncbi:Glutamate receptor-interacting protein 1 [Trichinella pseudospiralis]|uniref:Glutamate receptor-interacting protein 1 n=1 Tax=Trichinella pseudospiralis TaxID=6337 RepID=A0A0V1DVW0_TRIPS|nr:Glutamate receptor-interacting protein 1 [Trichinella pseudospiralis]
MKAYVQLARVRNFFEFFALLHANLSGHWSVKQRPASRSVGRSVGRWAGRLFPSASLRQLTSSRPTSSRQWSLVGPKIRPSGRENRVAQTSLHSVAYLLYSTCASYRISGALPVRSDSTVQPCLHHRHNLAKWLSLDELRYRPAVFTSTCTRPKPLHIRALPPITSRYSLTEGVADDKPSAGGQRHRPLAALVSATKLATHVKSNVCIAYTVYRVSTNRFYQKDIPEESKATVAVELYRESDSSWGIGISGGADKGYKPFISCVRAGSIADRSDSILVGDHLLEVNGIRVETLTYNEILNLLKNAGQHISLLTAYNLNDLSFTPSRTCIAKTFELKLEKEERSIGFVVRGGRTDGIAHPATVVHIRPGGPVNREGRLRIGDRILAINGIDLRQQSLARITDLLSKSAGTVRLSVEYDVLIIDSIKNTARPILLEIDKPPGCDLGVRLQLIGDASYASKRIFRIVGIVPASIADSVVEIQLSTDNDLQFFHFTAHFQRIHGNCERKTNTKNCTRLWNRFLLSIARCGVLQIGDRVLALNDWCTELGSAEQANQLVKHMTSPLTLTVEFDVIESVLQNCGVFTVKLARRTQNLGLLIRPACGSEKGEPVIVAEVEIGSVAYRCGTIQPGDQILAIDNIPLDSCTVEEANRLLDRSSDVVKLRIKKYCCSCERVDCGGAHMIVYSIEINRRGCPLGIAVSAGDEHLNHVLITQLVPGGLAEKTGAIHVGDRLLAINGRPLDRLPIQEVARLLQEAPELLTLKIGRSPQDRARLNQSNAYQQQLDRNLRDCIYQQMPNKKLCTPVQSVDSAVESLEDCPIVESLPHLTATKRSKSSSLSITGAENSHDVDGLRYSMKMKECSQLNSNNIDEVTIEWCKVLEALESIGEPETLVKLEETILAGAVPCVSNCGPQLVPPPMPKVSSPPTTSCQKTILRRPQTCNLSKVTSQQSANPSRHQDGLLRVNYMPGSTPVSRTASPKCTDLNTATVYEQIPFVDESDASSQQPSMTAVNTVLTVHVPQTEKLNTNTGSGSTTDDSATPTAVRLHRVVLRKDQVHNDFGFSISDGVEERGIFVRDIRPNGPADKSRNIFPFDRILKVNDISVQDVDCLLVAPLLAACGDKVELLLSRTALLSTARQSNDHQSDIS